MTATPRIKRALEVINTSAGRGAVLLPPPTAVAMGSHLPATPIGGLDVSAAGVITLLDATTWTPARIGDLQGLFVARFAWEVTSAAPAGASGRINTVLRRDFNDQELARINGPTRPLDALAVFTERMAEELARMDQAGTDGVEPGTRIDVRLELEVIATAAGTVDLSIHHDPSSAPDRFLTHIGWGELPTT